MRILYITFGNRAVGSILAGMRDEELSGLSPLYYPFKMLLEQGHRVDMLLFSPSPEETVVESRYFGEKNLFHVRTADGPTAKLRLPFTVWRETKKRLRRERYDFVYGMSEGSVPGLCAAERMGVPCALRQFGTQEMVNALETIDGKWKRWLIAWKDYTYIALSLLTRRNFILATNDGSRSDELFSLLGLKKRRFDYYFWRSGVSIPPQRHTPDNQGTYPEAYDPWALSHVGRVTDVKRQDRSVRILGELRRRGYPFQLYFVGDFGPQTAWYRHVERTAEEAGVAEYIHFVGNQSQNVCRKYARNAFATILPGEWNRVNIFYEAMSEGALLLTNNNHSVDEFVEDGVNCLLYDAETEAAEKLIALIDRPERRESIRSGAYQTAVERFLPLERRFALEVRLLLDTAAGRDTKAYPARL